MAYANTYDTTNTGSATMNREDILDLLTVLSPEETPVLSMIPKSEANATFVEFGLDKLDNPAFAGVQEGVDVTTFTNKASNRAKIGNYIQIFRRDWQVSQVQARVSIAGVASETAHDAAQCAKELKTDIESAICSDNDRSAEDGGGTNFYLTRGLGDWIDDSGPSDVPSAYQTPSGSIDTTSTGANFSEAKLNDLLESRYETIGRGGDNLCLVAGPAVKQSITNFARAEGTSSATPYTVTQPAESKKITLNVLSYEGDFGSLKIIPTLFNGRTTGTGLDNDARRRGYIFDPAHLGLATLAAESSTSLEDRGGGARGYAQAMAALVCKAPQALCKIALAG